MKTYNNRRATVALARCLRYEPGDVRQAIEKALEPFGGMRAVIGPGMRVLLKPNLVSGRPPEQAVNTHPVFVETVARMALELGAKPSIGDSPGFPRARSAAKPCGIYDVAKRLGIPLIELGEAVTRPMTIGGVRRSLRLSGTALEFDAILNLPKLKCHSQLYMTVATKNLFGIVPGKRKAMWHMRLGPTPRLFAQMLVQVAAAAAPAITLVDAIVGLERGGPIHGDPRALGFVMAGDDCAAVDRVAVEAVGADPGRLITLEAARALGIGVPDLERIDLRGDPLAGIAIPDFVKVEAVAPMIVTPMQAARVFTRFAYRRFVNPPDPV